MPEATEQGAVTTPDSGTTATDTSAVTTAEATVPETGSTLLTGSDTATTETKPEDQAPEGDAKAVVTEVPEKYELTMADGLELDAAALEAFTPVAKELGLDNAKAQKVADVYATLKVAEKAAAHEAWVKQVAGWEAESRADKTFGGQQFEGSRVAALAVINKYGPPGLKPLLEESGLGNHPVLFAFCAGLGKAMGEDTLHTGSASADVDTAKKMFPNTK